MVRIEPLLRIMRSRLEMLTLHCARRRMPLSGEPALISRGLVPNAARSARISHMPVIDDRRVVNDRLIPVDVVETAAYMHDRRVVEEVAAAPFAAGKTDAHVPEAIVDAAVVSNMQSPIAVMEDVMAAVKAPVRGRPEKARLRSRHPRARDPVVAGIAVSPVTRRPDISIIRAERLFINRQHRRSNADTDEHSGKRRRRNEGKQKRYQEKAC